MRNIQSLNKEVNEIYIQKLNKEVNKDNEIYTKAKHRSKQSQ